MRADERRTDESNIPHVEAFDAPLHWRTALYSAEVAMPVHMPYAVVAHILVATAISARADGFTSN